MGLAPSGPANRRGSLLADCFQLASALPHSGHRLSKFFVRDVQVSLTGSRKPSAST